MKTKEFIRQVEELGLVVQVNSKATFIKKANDAICVIVDERYIYSFDTMRRSYDNLEDSKKSKLFNLLVEYASTPIEKRKEEKKYYIKIKYTKQYYSYLNYCNYDEHWFFNNQWSAPNYKVQFTLSELPKWVHEMLEQGHLVKEEVE